MGEYVGEWFDASAYGRAIADIYDETAQRLPVEPVIETISRLAGRGPVLEFGIGTGRLALPLAARGIPVAGVDGSPEMVKILRAKPGGDHVPVTVGDFSEARVEGVFSLVLLAVNTVFALPSQDAQVRCFRNAAAHLRPGGRFVVEAWVPDPAAFRDRTSLRLLSVAEEEVVVEAARLCPAEQLMHTTKLRMTADGLRLLPANHRYAWPCELDLMARLAGMERERRWADWSGTPFTDDSRAHVSVYRVLEG
ncbi:class I SAM-dependent methyltransferase [Microbispora triticiradicis]|uniref:Class I SAM-dependent methyltransferase n=3 Tax=Microbispora TaxID=2005 RepID=A0ABY3M2P9_9ACTN|nr:MULTISPECIES: class I SAM-dependent methyltransferase [Microbispora]RGA01001.1 class I SAM-dependent methyltransferase [Microbispora triticiradicis]TLP57751.1 class I SAM-dependent methyltransferase [Microbispora fusca]TYB64653.1 class I SAM-dependent methyltransferase [Microbispora tritici]